MKNNKKRLKIVLFLLLWLFLLIGILSTRIKFNTYQQQSLITLQDQQKKSTKVSKNILPLSKLVYNSKGRAKIYDFQNSKEIDLGLSGVTKFLWSKNGQLAALVQGKYGGKKGFLGISRIFATTEGFNYLLYLVDLEGKKPKLILPEVFGEVFWSEDSTGFYFSENYWKGKPILLGEQFGLKADEIKTFFISISGIKKPVNRKTFEKERIFASEKISPNGKFYIISDNLKNFDKIVEIETGKEYSIKPGIYMKKTFNSKWSPSGKKIAFVYKVSEEVTKNSILKIVAFDEVLTQNFSNKLKGSLPSAEIIDFDWINEQSIIVSQLNYISQPGYYQGNIGIYDIGTDKFKIIVSSITQKIPYSNTILCSPDRKFFIYQTSNDLGKEEIIISNLEGKEIKKLNGRDPSWEPIK